MKVVGLVPESELAPRIGELLAMRSLAKRLWTLQYASPNLLVLIGVGLVEFNRADFECRRKGTWQGAQSHRTTARKAVPAARPKRKAKG